MVFLDITYLLLYTIVRKEFADRVFAVKRGDKE